MILSTYVISGIHGNYNTFVKMIDKIKFNENDKMYILGDVVDRGNEPIELIEYIRSFDNITVLMGNHEDMMLEYYNKYDTYSLLLWIDNGGDITKEHFEKLSHEEREDILDWMSCLNYTAEIEVNSKKFILGHASPYAKSKESVLWSRVYPQDDSPTSDEIYIRGHTPVICFDDKQSKRKVARIKRSIDNRTWFIDCGCGITTDDRCRLCCIRLDDEKEFYVKVNE
jgi:serine/threonine protein phosphatase 1